VRLLLASLLLCAPLLAQQTPDQKLAETVRMRRTLQGKRAEVDRLLELRMRHDLGLPTDGNDRTFVVESESTPRAMDSMRRELREQEAMTTSMRQRFEKLRKEVAALRSEAESAVGDASEEHPSVTMPTAGSQLPFAGGREFPSPVDPAPRQPVAPAPAGETAPKKPAAEQPGALALDPLRAQIHGSTDHQRVAQALFKAGQALLDRGELERSRGNIEAGRELDARGKERLVRAIEELDPLLQQESPPYVSLFYLGRCRELLFRYSERHEGLSLSESPREFQRREQEVREPFLAISARDVQKGGVRAEVEMLGSWGQAAQTAMEHFRWMNLHAGYDAKATIDSLTWPGEGEQ